MRTEELIKEEIQLAEDECCIVFDFGCFFPYSNPEELTFRFSLGEEKFDDYKMNHRYPNRSYRTITKKYGRKLSKLGYPYIMKLNEQVPTILRLDVGIKERYMTLLFLLQTRMTKDMPFCDLLLNYNFDKNKFYFISHEKVVDDVGWYRHIWNSHENELLAKGANNTLLSAPRLITGSRTLVYDDSIIPHPSTLSNLMVTNGE